MGPATSIAADLLHCQQQQQHLLGFVRQAKRMPANDLPPGFAAQIEVGNAVNAMQTLRCHMMLRTFSAANDCHHTAPTPVMA